MDSILANFVLDAYVVVGQCMQREREWWGRGRGKEKNLTGTHLQLSKLEQHEIKCSCQGHNIQPVLGIEPTRSCVFTAGNPFSCKIIPWINILLMITGGPLKGFIVISINKY